jgi:hypothetical protein
MIKKPNQSRDLGQSPDQLIQSLSKLMEKCESADALNDNVIVPFIVALESVCGARGYVLNIYGEKSNVVITNEADAPALYEVIEEYLDSVGEDDA